MSDLCLLFTSLLNANASEVPDSFADQRSLYCEDGQKTPEVQKQRTFTPPPPQGSVSQPEFSKINTAPASRRSIPTFAPTSSSSGYGSNDQRTAYGSPSTPPSHFKRSSWSSVSVGKLTPKPSISPKSGAQLYQQRLTALKAGTLYSRLSEDTYYDTWKQASKQPTHQQWQKLLQLEASTIARGQGNNQLNVMLGDSLSLWFPPHLLPKDQLWLNQSISGENTGHILQRMSAFSQTRPDTIYIMAGINDLRHGATDVQILNNMKTMIRRLKQTHPQARIVVQSILPTRWASLGGARIERLNRLIKETAQMEGVIFLDLFYEFSDSQGMLRRDLTTDGLHLSDQGYQVWQAALRQSGL
jgi:lysophospholipase L1-like esterase